MRTAASLTSVVALALAMFASVAATPSRALAHGALRKSQPASGAQLSAVPRELRLTFSEPPVPAFTRITLRGPGGEVALAPLRIDSVMVAVAAIIGRLRDGSYTVAWQVAGADGHPVRGTFAFTVLPGATGLEAPVAPAVAAAPGGEAGGAVPAPAQHGPSAEHHAGALPDSTSFDAESPAFVAVRSLLYAALLGVIGAVVFRQVILQSVARTGAGSAPAQQFGAFALSAGTRAAIIGMWAARLVLLAALLRLLAQSRAMHGDALFDAGLVGTMLTQTLWGWGWIAQVTGALVGERAFAAARRGGSWAVATGAAIVLAFTPALASHAAASPRLAGLAMALDGVHVLAAGAWMGGLLLVLMAGIPSAFASADEDTRGAAIARLVIAFSPLALVAAGALAVTGVFASWLHLGSTAALWQSDYGRVLLVKLAVLGGVALTGLYNWRVVLPRLGSASAGAALRRSARAELMFGALVVIVTAVLVAMPTGTAPAP